MKNARILCIDFGSAYTKVALRRDWNETVRLVWDIPLADRDTSFCVPSVVARVERLRGPRWLVGQEAAAQRPGDGVTVYRDLKAGLFTEGPAEQKVKDTIGREGFARRVLRRITALRVKDTIGSEGFARHDAREHQEVGVIFFKELRDTLRKMSLRLDIEECPLRLCIPRLDKNPGAREVMIKILSDAGWSFAENRETVYEPESNAIGVVTRGLNATWYPPLPFRQQRFPMYLRMFDPKRGPLAAFRQAFLQKPRRDFHYGVLVVDIGAFTTDFGYVEFDESFYNEKVPCREIIQISREVGIRELDRSVHDRMRPEVQHAIGRISMSDWEIAKRRLYSGSPAAIRNPEGGVLKIGTGSEAKTIADAIGEFAARVVEERRVFCSNKVRGHIDAQVLTGGGAMIPLVHDILVKAMKDEQGGRFYDLLDNEEPYGVLLQKKTPAGNWEYDREEVEARVRQNLELTRGASAIGGCSVFFEWR